MSRRKGRYERRKTRREENRLRRVAAVGGLHDVFGYDDNEMKDVLKQNSAIASIVELKEGEK